MVLKLVSKITLRLNLNKQSCGLHSTIRRTLFCSRIMGFLPLSGLMETSSDKLRFSLRSPYTIFYAITLFGQVMMSVMALWWLIQTGFSLSNITNFFFYASSLASFLIMMNIGWCWPRLITETEAIESKLPPFTRNVASISHITMAFILLAAAIEHILSVLYGLTVAHYCDSNNLAENYFRFNMPWIFNYTSFNIWKGIISELFNIQSTFLWSYNDLLLMVISIYLTEHLLVHNELLKKAVQQEHFRCDEFRTQYLKIVHLVKLINGQFGIYILTSFGSNLYWICTQLFYSLNKSQTGHFITCTFKEPAGVNALNGIEHAVYFNYSFAFLTVRTTLVLMLAARIHSNSVAPLFLLYKVPSSRFNIERKISALEKMYDHLCLSVTCQQTVVERFIAQINYIKVAMSGLGFFYVTRTMILTLLGTIVTYELVLLQFNNK